MNPHLNPSPADEIARRALGHFRNGDLAATELELARKGGVALKSPLGLNLHASVLLRRGQPEKALAFLEKAARLAPSQPETHFQLGIALGELRRNDGAVAAFDRALALRPRHAEALINRAVPLSRLGRCHDALASLDAAAALAPRSRELRFNRGTLRLALGDFERGWEDFEARLERPDVKLSRPRAHGAAWKGESLAGRSILVHGEQGLGDAIQFTRLLRAGAFAGSRLTVLLDSRLHRLLTPLLADATVVEDLGSGTSFDFVCPLLSLPRALRARLDEAAGPVPYLEAEPAVRERWKARVGARGFRVGICWQGNARAPLDAGRSLPLRCFEPLAHVPGVRLISLQKNEGVEQLGDLPAGMPVETLGEDFDAGPDAFVDAAGVMADLDLVVTSDTAMAHLAGALGVPVWLALRRDPDWRWLLEREDCPWYPTMRLVRQEVDGDWQGVFARMAAALPVLAARREVA